MASDNWGDQIAVPFQFALGSNPQSFPGALAARAQGYVNTSSTSNQAVRATAYTPSASSGQRSVASTNANDASGGHGSTTDRHQLSRLIFRAPLGDDSDERDDARCDCRDELSLHREHRCNPGWLWTNQRRGYFPLHEQ